jgi:cysteine synthase B
MIYENVLQMIGNTPLIRINHLNPNNKVKILAKLEGYNPTGSIKDRIALKMIEQAEDEEVLTRGKIIIELTSGNTGIGLAMIGALKGYAVEIVLSKAVSEERVKMIEAFGATVIRTPAEEGTDGAIKKAHELVEQYPQKYFMPNQFSNKYNKIAHYKTTGEEIWQQTQGKITHLVSSIGTSGTIMGVGRALKKKNPDIRVIEAQPTKGHYIQGLKNMQEALVPEIYDSSKIDEHIMIESEEAFDMARKLVRKEGLLVGMSAGAAMLAAYRVAQKIETGVIVVIFADRGEKYLSTDLFRCSHKS